MTPTGPDAFLDVYAATGRLTLGLPQQVQVAADGDSVLYLRSRTGTDSVSCLWRLPLGVDAEPTLLVDPSALVGDAAEVTDQERVAQRRTRSQATGLTGYSASDDHQTIGFGVGGDLFLLSGADDRPRRLPVAGPVDAVTLSPDAEHIGYVREGDLLVCDLAGAETVLARAEPDVSWGLPELVAAEEIGRTRGFWWLADGRRTLGARVAEAAVTRWWFHDLAQPESAPISVRYPRAGEANAAVSLAVFDLDGRSVPVDWDNETFPYLVTVRARADRLFVVVQTRDQRRIVTLLVDPDTGDTTAVDEQSADHWLAVVPGVPDWLADGTPVRVVEHGDARRLQIGTDLVSPPEVQIREVVGVHADEVIVAGSTDPRQTHLFRWRAAGGWLRLTDQPGVHAGQRSAGGLAVTADPLADTRRTVTVTSWDGRAAQLPAATPPSPLDPRPEFRQVGERGLACALLLPATAGPHDSLPVLLDPYGGPGAQRVTAARRAHALSQWLADQGFAVLVVDGRGTPGRGLAWEHALDGDLGTASATDQLDALLAVAGSDPRLDLTRVGVRGWSFGGYLALQLAMRRPDLIRAAVCGAPVTDWRGYDTHYTERFLGLPADDPDAYARSAVPEVPTPADPPALLLIHGLADDNVHPAHTMSISDRLTRQGWPHDTLYLPQAHHRVTDPDQLRRWLQLEVAFFRRHLHAAEPSR